MRRISKVIILAFISFSMSCCVRGSNTVPKDKMERIEQFLRNVVADTLREDYQRHNIYIDVLVTDLRIDKVKKKETEDYIFYDAQGKVSYIIKGKRKWVDREGNIIQLDPEEEITHWFSSGILEDRYGDLLKDKGNRLTFYADDPKTIK
jgi:hypothetical protein